MTSKTVTMKTVDYDRMIAGENGLRDEIVSLRAALVAWRRFAEHAAARQWAIPLWGALLWDEAIAATETALAKAEAQR